MKKLIIGSGVVFLVSAGLVFPVAGQRGGRGGAATGQQAPPPTVFMGCVTGGNLQPTEQPFKLEPSEPFVLNDVVIGSDTTRFAATNYRVTGIYLTPWLGMRVRVEGALVAPRPNASGPEALPEIKATRITSMWGTCPSPAAWQPRPKN
jgi:hypothetical protein